MQTIVVKRQAVASRWDGGVARFEADAPGAVHGDAERLTVTFDDARTAEEWLARLAAAGIAGDDVSLRTPGERFELLFQSESGLRYVREKRGGVMRVLTESELADFNDPPPCPECAEQFGCDHFNCAGEPLLSDGEIEADVPEEWRAFAKENGVSRHDLDRLRGMQQVDGRYRPAADGSADVRTMELVLLLNGE